MPELPEVETIAQGLQRHIVGKIISDIECRRPDLRLPIPENLREDMIGKSVVHVSRRAKFLQFHLDEGMMISHLGMTGRWLFHANASPATQKHDHVIIRFTDGAALIYNDARRFGYIGYSPEGKVHPWFRDIGPEPLSNNFHAPYLHTQCQGRKAPIKQVIMDQSVVAGVGNIYACEALFRAGVHPAAEGRQLSMAECEKLAQSIRSVLKDAIESGGSTLRDYVRSTGDVGFFQHQFAVYGRAGDVCNTCGDLVDMVRQSGRSSFFCGSCQPEKKQRDKKTVVKGQ